jgi:FkbM family methyltransferase
MGMRGINVEANPMLIGNFQRMRPKDVNLNIAIGDQDGEMNFYVMNHPALSTLSEAEAKNYEGQGFKILKVIPVQTLSVASMLKKYWQGTFPEVVSLDAEGYDLQILKTIDWDDRTLGIPKIICVECVPYEEGVHPHLEDLANHEIALFLKEKGYAPIAFTSVNGIFALREWVEGRR